MVVAPGSAHSAHHGKLDSEKQSSAARPSRDRILLHGYLSSSTLPSSCRAGLEDGQRRPVSKLGGDDMQEEKKPIGPYLFTKSVRCAVCGLLIAPVTVGLWPHHCGLT